MPDGRGLVAVLTAALPVGVALAMDDPRAGPYGLLPGEALHNAVPGRLAEFAAGRRAARAAMAQLGRPAVAIAHGADRAPQWPPGILGSITHTDDLCLAVVGRSDAWIGLGLDVERDVGLDAPLWPDILRPDEAARIAMIPVPAQPHVAMAVFAAKEAVYKAQYPASLTLMDFHALSVEMSGDRFAARFTRDVPGFAIGTAVPGQLCRAGGYIAAFCAIRRP